MSGDMVEILVPGPPVAWRRPGQAKAGGRFTYPEVRRHAETIQQAWLVAGRPDFGKAELTLSISFYLAPKQREFDLDNGIKLVCDALEKRDGAGLYDNDRQVVCFSGCHRFRAPDEATARTVITAWLAPADLVALPSAA